VVKAKPRTVEVPALVKLPASDRVAATSRAATGANAGIAVDGPGSREQPTVAGPGRFTGRRKLALGIAAIGVAAAGVSLGFGLEARSVENQADAICPAAACTDAHAVELNRAARRDALVANIGLATAGAAIIAAAVLWFTGSPKPGGGVSVAPVLGSDRAGISLSRGF
jgi:hypothetical protein